MELECKKSLLGLAIATLTFSGAGAFAQIESETQAPPAQQSQTPAAEQEEPSVADEDEIDNIVVTGSRLKRDTFTSIAPLQVINSQVSREAGLIDPANILQDSTAATGQQIDLTFSNFVLDNGPGSQTVSLRGLGAARTLVLIDGRRVAPAGVEGAPSAPDLNMVPGIFVDRYEILLDGASSIYGSDAVAGVANVILRKDFDGVEIQAYTEQPSEAGGESNSLGIVWGESLDRGFFGIGVEYNKENRARIKDRPWTEGCERPIEEDENGNTRRNDIYDATRVGMETDGCALGLLAGRVSVPEFGSVYWDPTGQNSGIPGFSESEQFGLGIDADGDGRTDVNYRDYDLNGRSPNMDLFPDSETYNFMSYGEYTLEGDANLTPFYELQYARRRVDIQQDALQLFPVVPASNPFNPCNPAAAGGVDCGLAWDSLMNDPEFIAQVMDAYGADPSDPAEGLLVGAIGAGPVQPITAVRGDRDHTDVEVNLLRSVAGFRGDMPFIDFGGFNNWSFEVAGIYSKSKGESHRPGIRGDRLSYSLETSREDPANPGSIICGTGDDCVPINMFAPSLYDGIIGDFATPEERAYLFDSRDFDTEYTQKAVSVFFTGDLVELPAGTVNGGFGFEWRNDKIASIPDEVARDGLFFGFFSDGGATGDKDTKEFFLETEIPILAGIAGVEELTANLSGRYTKDEFFDGAWTYSAKIGYRPVNSLLLRATTGTSYRAPNLRENFLKAQTGFLDIYDPCVVPEAALDNFGNYVPGSDPRDATIINNCVAQGVDPTTLDNNGVDIYSSEVFSGGATNLVEETSDSVSLGFVFDQPWFDGFELTLGATYYSIEIDDTIIEPTPAFLVNDCYVQATASAFCNRITRDADGFIALVDSSYLNRDNETVRGVDVNINYTQELPLFNRSFEFGADLRMNHIKETSELFVGENGEIVNEEYSGEIGFPDWNGQLDLHVTWSDYRVRWTTRYIGSQKLDRLDVDEWGDVFDPVNTSETCLGPTAGDVRCRDVGDMENYFTHSLSLFYYADTWSLGAGVRNLFDEEPPEVNSDEVLSINNTPIGYGYDLQGRSFFLDFQLQL